MKKNNFVVVMTILVGIIWLFTPIALVSAEAEQTLQVEATNYVISSQWLPVGDEAGHVIGMNQREGEGVFSNGETAKYSVISTFDARRSKGGIAQGYSKFTFDDGSLIIFSWTTEFARSQEGLPFNQGQGTIIAGTGRFAGITGVSAFSSKQLKPASEDPKLTMVANATITYTLP
ncbi:MAG: hypothetical protein K0R78_1614 [Pelosinus sp.]|jgi:hypothetical protein|nr:hypothetical protein [Pelosinus sp.]